MKKYVFILLFFMSFSLNVQATPRFEADVSVDVTAKTVSEAKKQAMSKALRDGLKEVILGISTQKAVDEISQLNDNQLEHFITEVMVLMEKTSDVRYIADLRVSVNGDILKAYIQENDLPLIVAEETEAVVIPVLETKEGKTDVWADDNMWRQTFAEKPHIHKGNINIHLIDKNLGNIAVIKPNRVLDMAEGEYREIMDFNRADSLYVLKYIEKDKVIVLKEYPRLFEEKIDVTGITPQEMIEKVLPYFKSVSKVEKSEDVHNDVFETINVVYTYQKLSDWMTLKKILDNQTQVQDIRLMSMGNGKVHFNFQYSGVIEKLQGILSVNGYAMINEGGHYVIN